MAFSKYGGNGSGGATGFGVRLLNKLVEDYYEWFRANIINYQTWCSRKKFRNEIKKFLKITISKL